MPKRAVKMSTCRILVCRHSLIPDIHATFMLLPHFRIFRQSAHIAYFLHKLAFSTAVLILFVILLPISIRFRYLDHLIANRMAPPMCPNPCGTRWRSWFQAILYHISAAYLAFMRSAYFIIFNENAA